MGTSLYIYDQFVDIVTATTTRSGITCHYQFGHPMEILENLRAMTRDPKQDADKYPLIALFTDYQERKGETPGISSIVKLNLIIATLTNKDYSAQERTTITFKPILYPIYEALLIEIARSGYYNAQGPEKLPHTKYDRLFWGKNGLYTESGNVFEDLIDCIEINDLELSVFKNSKC